MILAVNYLIFIKNIKIKLTKPNYIMNNRNSIYYQKSERDSTVRDKKDNNDLFESDNKILNLIKRSDNLIKISIPKFLNNSIEDDNILFLYKSNELKLNIISYEIDNLVIDAEENLKLIKANNYFDVDLMPNDNSNFTKNNFFDYDNINNSSEKRLSIYNKCFEICNENLKEISNIILNSIIKDKEIRNSRIKNNQLNSFISQDSNNIQEEKNQNTCLNLNLNLKFNSGNFMNKALHLKTRTASFAIEKSSDFLKKLIPLENSFWDNYILNDSFTNENIQINNIPNSKILKVKKPVDKLSKRKIIKNEFNFLSSDDSFWNENEDGITPDKVAIETNRTRNRDIVRSKTVCFNKLESNNITLKQNLRPNENNSKDKCIIY